MEKLTLSKTIEFTLFLYVLSLYFLTQQEGLHLISNAVALILISLIWLNVLMRKKKIRINNFSIAYILFIFICMVSILYAVNSATSFAKSRTLILNFILMFSLINYIDSLKKIKKILSYFIVSGFLTSLFIIFTSDFSDLTRMGSELGNVNAIGMLITLSTVFCFYFIIENRAYKYLPILVINISSILLTGSRKALLFLITSLIFILFTNSTGSLKKKIKYSIIGLVSVVLVTYIVFNNPIFYQIIGRRMESLINVFTGTETIDQSLKERNYMIEFGFNWFKDRPLLGYGIDNYRFLLNNRVGLLTYSHNNIVELLVGIGILGTFFYYYAQFVIVKDLLKSSRCYPYNKLNYLFIIVIIAYLLISISLVYYDSKPFNIILAISSVYPNIHIKEKRKKER